MVNRYEIMTEAPREFVEHLFVMRNYELPPVRSIDIYYNKQSSIGFEICELLGIGLEDYASHFKGTDSFVEFPRTMIVADLESNKLLRGSRDFLTDEDNEDIMRLLRGEMKITFSYLADRGYRTHLYETEIGIDDNGASSIRSMKTIKY